MAEVLEDDVLLDDESRTLAAGDSMEDFDDDQIAILLAQDMTPVLDRPSGNDEMMEIGDKENEAGPPVAQEVLLGEVIVDEGFEEAPEAVIEEEVVEEEVVEEEAAEEEMAEEEAVEEEMVEEEVVEEEVIHEEEVTEVADCNDESSGTSSTNGDIEEIHSEDTADDVLLMSDNEVKEDHHATGEAELEEEEGSSEGNTTRKRAGTSSSPKPPVHKRTRTDRPFLEARKKVIELIESMYGSWDALLNVSQLRVISDMRKKNFNDIVEAYMKGDSDEHAVALSKQLADEQKAHAITKNQLDELMAGTKEIRAHVKRLSTMITQPATQEMGLREVGSRGESTSSRRPPVPTIQRQSSDMTSVSQQDMVHHNRQPASQPVHQLRYHPQPIPPMDEAARLMLEQRRIHDRNLLLNDIQIRQAQQQMNGTPRPTMARSGPPIGNMVRTPIARAPPVVPRTPSYGQVSPQQPKFPQIPRNNAAMGHHHKPVQANYPQEILDQTKDNTIMLCVPYVPQHLVISCGDSTRLPILPRMLTSLHKTADLTVNISSSPTDFRENWQIGGKINYENLGMRDRKTIQVFVQVSSLKATGLQGRPNIANPMDCLNWGISKAWPCREKFHKFRLQFHHHQVLPINDRITIVVIARNISTGAVECSDTVYMNLT